MKDGVRAMGAGLSAGDYTFGPIIAQIPGFSTDSPDRQLALDGGASLGDQPQSGCSAVLRRFVHAQHDRTLADPGTGADHQASSSVSSSGSS